MKFFSPHKTAALVAALSLLGTSVAFAEDSARTTCSDMLKLLQGMKESGNTGDEYGNALDTYQTTCVNVRHTEVKPAVQALSNGNPCEYVKQVIARITAALEKEPDSRTLTEQLKTANAKLDSCDSSGKTTTREEKIPVRAAEDGTKKELVRPLPIMLPMAGSCDEWMKMYKELAARLTEANNEEIMKKITDVKEKLARCNEGGTVTKTEDPTLLQDTEPVACVKKGAMITCDDGFKLDLRMVRQMMQPKKDDGAMPPMDEEMGGIPTGPMTSETPTDATGTEKIARKPMGCAAFS